MSPACEDPIMQVLLVGGSGYVAGLVLPLLSQRHAVRVLDRRPPAADVEHVLGSATDYVSLRSAAEGMDAVVHCAMGSDKWSTPEGAADAFDVNVKSVHLTLLAARDAGVRHAVYVSSMSVYRDLRRRPLDETVPSDATDLYGLTKRLGEEVCLAAAAEWGLSINVLRLVWPTPDEVWPAWGPPGMAELLYTDDGTLIEATRGSDVGRAVLAALDHRDGCQLFTISGDESARLWSTAKARRVLGWSPTSGPNAPRS
jgi:nucleoside-diphosphate-sugar epimerase